MLKEFMGRRWTSSHFRCGSLPHRKPGELETIYLMTTLTDSKKYPAKELSKIYKMRWSIEEDIKVKKCRMEIRKFFGSKPSGRQARYLCQVAFPKPGSCLEPPHKETQAHGPPKGAKPEQGSEEIQTSTKAEPQGNPIDAEVGIGADFLSRGFRLLCSGAPRILGPNPITGTAWQKSQAKKNMDWNAKNSGFSLCLQENRLMTPSSISKHWVYRLS